MQPATQIDDVVDHGTQSPAVALATRDPSENGSGTDSVAASELARLSPTTLAKRLVEYAGEERAIVAAFLQHLDEFDRRRGYLESGHGCLWDYCLRVLHLREGAAGRRIGAMRVARRFPKIVAAIRDGRLCLSTVTLLSPVLTEENFEELVARAAFKTKAQVEHLVASVRPRSAPSDGIRKVAAAAHALEVPAARTIPATSRHELTTDGCNAGTEPPLLHQNLLSNSTGLGSPSPTTASTLTAPARVAAVVTAVARPPVGARSASGTAAITPVARDSWSVRFTIDGEGKAELELLQALLSHKCGRNLASVMREAIRCAIDKHGKRRGVVPPRRAGQRPARERSSGSTPSRRGVATPHASISRTSVPPKSSDPRESSVRPESSDPRESSVPPESRAPPVTSIPRQTSVALRRDTIPAHVRQAVYERDGGTCSYVSPDGQRCDSRWKLEFDHILPAFLDGPPTIENVRLLCRAPEGSPRFTLVPTARSG